MIHYHFQFILFQALMYVELTRRQSLYACQYVIINNKPNYQNMLSYKCKRIYQIYRFISDILHQKQGPGVPINTRLPIRSTPCTHFLHLFHNVTKFDFGPLTNNLFHCWVILQNGIKILLGQGKEIDMCFGAHGNAPGHATNDAHFAENVPWTHQIIAVIIRIFTHHFYLQK